MNEDAMIQSAIERIRLYSDLPICRELPIYGRVADVAYILNDQLVTIEFKLNNLRQALAQAVDHRIASDRAYICTTRKQISEDIMDAINRSGVGLIFYSSENRWPFEVIIEAQHSDECWPRLRETIKTRLIARVGGLVNQ